MKQNQFNNDIRFLPIEITDSKISISSLYSKELKRFLTLNSINYQIDNITLNLLIDEKVLTDRLKDKIIDLIKRERDKILQKQILKNYL